MTTKIKERPITLSAQEVNAVLAGDKTQHRVPLSSQPYVNEHGWNVLKIGGVQISDQCVTTSPFDEAVKSHLPDTNAAPYRVGDRLWVQEPTLAIEDVGWIGPVFVASDKGRHSIDWGYGPYDDPAHIPACELTYNKPSDLSRKDSRLFLEITDIRIERVTEITHSDAIAEHCFNFGENKNQCIPPLTGFAEYWREKHGDDAWRSNPWVWVVEFKAIERGSDA